MKQEKVCIVMPAYNEEKRIRSTLETYSSFFEKLRKEKKIDYTILVVINGTTDNTEKIVSSISKKNDRIKYVTLIRGGKGYATREGFNWALKSDYALIGFVDADMATPPEAYYDLITQIKKYDSVIASRYISGAIVLPKPSVGRVIASRIFNSLIRAVLLLPYRDTQCGAKIFKRKAVEYFLPRLTMSKWAFDVDILYNLHKAAFRILEHPTTWRDKEYSKINFLRAGPMMALGIVRLRIINSPLKFIIRVYDFLAGRINRMLR